jgi:soluble cytochrome b562
MFHCRSRRSRVAMGFSCLVAVGLAAWSATPAVGQPERNTPGQPSVQPRPARPESVRPDEVRPIRPREGIAPQQQPGERGPGRGPGGPGADFRNLEGAMKTLNRGFKLLEQSIDAADQRDRVLGTLAQMQRAVIFAKEQPVEHVPDGMDPKKAADEFRGMGAALLAELATVEKLVLSGDSAGAKSSLKKVAEIRDAGHDKFQAKDEHEENEGEHQDPNEAQRPAGGR